MSALLGFSKNSMAIPNITTTVVYDGNASNDSNVGNDSLNTESL